MSLLKENNSILMGIMIGATVPVLGYFAIEMIFELLTQQGLMDSVSAGSSGKRLRTLALMSICCNIIPIQLLNNKRIDAKLKGVLIATFIYCTVWAIKFAADLI